MKDIPAKMFFEWSNEGMYSKRDLSSSSENLTTTASRHIIRKDADLFHIWVETWNSLLEMSLILQLLDLTCSESYKGHFSQCQKQKSFGILYIYNPSIELFGAIHTRIQNFSDFTSCCFYIQLSAYRRCRGLQSKLNTIKSWAGETM